MAYRAVACEENGVPCWDLAGPDDSRVLVLPGHGSQLASLRLSPGAGAPALEVLEGLPPERIRQAGWEHGTPVLFPFPGRLRDGTYNHGGRVYRMPGSGRHPLHGLVGLVPWEVTGSGDGADGAWVATAVEHDDLDVSPDAFPGSYRLEVVHRLGPDGYRQEVRVRNVGDAPFPFGYGWHPHFRVPLGSAGPRADCTLRLAARARWELSADLLPTGRRLAVSGSYDLREPNPLGDKSYDDPFTLLEPEPNGGSRVELEDPAGRLRLWVWAAAEFPHWVIYAPRKSGIVAIEPYTCTPDAFNLETQGVPTGLRELRPGEEWSTLLAVGLSGTA